MDFSAIADIINKNPVIALALVVAFCAWVIASMGRSGQANFSSMLAFAGTQTIALNTAASNIATLEREKGALKATNDSLTVRVEKLENEVVRLKEREKVLLEQAEQVDFLSLRIEELQAKHDALQKELDAEKRKNTELQTKLNTVQAELDAMRSGAHETPITAKMTEEAGDEIL